MSTKLKIVDDHFHFYDIQANEHSFLNQVDPGFESFVGDYASLPKKYLWQDYLRDSSGYEIEGLVWHEFLAADPIKECKWADAACQAAGRKYSMVAIIDFLDPGLEQKLETYHAFPHITAIREHMVWSLDNPLKRFAKRLDLLSDPTWQQQLNLLKRYDFKCSLEVFAHQLPDMIKVVRRYPNVGFTIAVMGWPQDLSLEGCHFWKKNLKELSALDNTCLSISAIECIFGMDWTEAQIRPWLLAAIEMFGTQRCMFGSHMPIGTLSRSFTELYTAYANIVKDFSSPEKEDLFAKTAAKWFRIK